MDRFWDEFSKSTIVSGLLALMVWCAIIYLAITTSEVPEVLAVGGGAIIGYFFRVKSEAQTARIQASIIESAETIHGSAKYTQDCSCPEDG